MNESFLRLPQVVARTGLSRSTIYARIAAGTFPRQIPLGERSSAWISSEVDQWINERVRLARTPESANHAPLRGDARHE